MTHLIDSLIRYGVPLVFLNVFLEQLGLPIPALPTLVVAGALSAESRMSSTHVFAASMVASLIADWFWFVLGRYHGYRVLRTLCRISLSPDSCVRDTEARFERWGPKSLLIAKFIPGFSTVAPPLAGAAKQSTISFLLYDGVGAALWIAVGVVGGRAFHHTIAELLAALENLGWWAGAILTVLLALLIAMKWMQRRDFYRQLRMARVSAEELKRMLDTGETPLIIDARSLGARTRDARRIPTAVVLEIDGVAASFRPPEEGRESRDIVVYCT